MAPVMLVADSALQERPVPEGMRFDIPKLTLPSSPQGDSTAINEVARLLVEAENPVILAGLLLGAMLPYVFSAMAINAVGRAAGDMIIEVQRQFRVVQVVLRRFHLYLDVGKQHRDRTRLFLFLRLIP